MDIGISTSWKSMNETDANGILDAIARIGCSSIEVDYRISKHEIERIRKRLLSDEWTVHTVHNPCPSPETHSSARPWRDAELSAADNDERKTATSWGIRSLECAADLGASLVVFHLGFVDIDPELDMFRAFYHHNQVGTNEWLAFRDKKLAERQDAASPYVDAALHSIDTLNNRADKLGVLVGVETRLHFHEIPFKEEFHVIFDEFDGAQLRYWHDVGHGEVLHRLGFVDHEKDLLERYQDRLAGFHIHDVNALTDHLPPGQGNFDFKKLTPYFSEQTIPILEVHEADAQEMTSGIEFLHEIGL